MTYRKLYLLNIIPLEPELAASDYFAYCHGNQNDEVNLKKLVLSKL